MDEIFELTETEEQIKERLERRIPYTDVIFGNHENYELVMEDIIFASRELALSCVFPFYDYSKLTLPDKYAQWQYKCCIELYNLADKKGFHTYSENGLSWGKVTDGVSKELITELTSKAGILQKIGESDDE